MDLSTQAGRARQGQRMQTALEAAGLTPTELARRIGCSRALVYQYLSGQVLAQPDRLQLIADLCGRPLAWFYLAEGETLPAEQRDAELERLRAELEAERQAFERGRARQVIDHLEALATAQENPPDLTALRRTCERLVERSRELADERLEAAAEYRLGNACYALGDLEAARAALTRALDRFRELGLPDHERRARQTLGAALAGLGERDRALAEFDRLLEGAGWEDAWRGHLGRADVFEALGRGEDALAELLAAERCVADQPDSPAVNWARLYIRAATANVYLLHDDYAAAEALAAACGPLAEEVACVGQHIEARLNLGFARRRLGRLADAAQSFADALRLARLTGDREREAVGRACRAELLACLGRSEEARAAGKDALAAALSLGAVRGEILAQLALAAAYERAGEHHEALYHARQGLAAASGHGLVKFEAVLRVAIARAQRGLGEVGALAEARRAAVLAETIGARAVAGLAGLEEARAALVAGRLEEAGRRAEEATRLAAETGDRDLGDEARLVLAETREAAGELAAAADLRLAWAADLWAVREALEAAGEEADLLADPARLTAVARGVTLLHKLGRSDEAEALLTAAAWPPLAERVRQLAEE